MLPLLTPLPVPHITGARAIKTAIGALILASLGGCVTLSNDAGFSDVQTTVSERIHQRVQWNRGTVDDEAAIEAVGKLLAKPLTADAAVQIALLNNRRLQATYGELGIGQAALVQAGLLRNPVFSATVWSPREGGARDLDFGITQDFLSVFFLPLRRRAAENEFEAAKLRVSGAAITVTGQVRSVFYRVQAGEQTLQLLRQIVTAAAAEFEASRRMYEAGNITELTFATEQALAEDAKLAFVRAEVDLAREREQLDMMMDLWGADTQWKVDPRLPEVPPLQPAEFADVEKRAVAANLDLAAARTELNSIAQRYGLTASVVQEPFDLGIQFEREGGEWSRGPSVDVAIPLFDFGQARRAGGSAVLRQFAQTYTAQAVEVRSAARTAAQTVAAAHASALHVRDVLVPLRSRIVEQTQLQYNAMQVGIFQLLQAKREQIAAGRLYIDSLRDYWIARTEFEQALNGRIGAVSRRLLETGVRAGGGLEGGGEQAGTADTAGH